MNFLIFHTDEHRADSLSPYNPRMKTPAIQSLADRGTVFMHNYCQSPVCMPSRSSTLSGRHPLEIGCLNNAVESSAGFPAGTVTFPELFARHGYATASFGKHHTFQHPIWQKSVQIGSCVPCLDHFGLHEPYKDEDYRVVHRKKGVKLASAGIFPDGEKDCAQYCVEQAQDFIADCGQPWLVRLSIEWPHNPVLCPRSFINTYPDTNGFVPLHTQVEKDSRSRYDKRIADFHGYDLFSQQEREWIWQSYYGLCAYVDSQVGRMLDWLKEKNLLEDTVVVFFSDHGRMLGEWGSGEKDVFDRPSWQTPMILAGPGVPKSVIEELTEDMDLGETLLDLAGIGEPFGGRALFQPHKEKNALVGCIKSEWLENLPDTFRFAVTTKEWRMDVNYDITGKSLSPEDADGGLYDLLNDPQERRNQFRNPDYASVVNAMYDLLNREFQKMQVDPRLLNPDYFRFNRSWEQVCGQKMR